MLRELILRQGTPLDANVEDMIAGQLANTQGRFAAIWHGRAYVTRLLPDPVNYYLPDSASEESQCHQRSRSGHCREDTRKEILALRVLFQ